MIYVNEIIVPSFMSIWSFYSFVWSENTVLVESCDVKHSIITIFDCGAWDLFWSILTIFICLYIQELGSETKNEKNQMLENEMQIEKNNYDSDGKFFWHFRQVFRNEITNGDFPLEERAS